MGGFDHDVLGWFGLFELVDWAWKEGKKGGMEEEGAYSPGRRAMGLEEEVVATVVTYVWAGDECSGLHHGIVSRFDCRVLLNGNQRR